MIEFNNFDDAVEMLIAEFDSNGVVRVGAKPTDFRVDVLFELTNDDVFELMHEDTEFMFELSRELFTGGERLSPSAYDMHETKFEEVKVKLITEMLKEAGY